VAKLLLGLLALFIVEIWVLIKVGSVIGALASVFLMLLSAGVGISLVRSQGLQTLLSMQQRMAAGELPAREILQGMLLAIAGLLLILPGFVTDAVGLLLLQPALRDWLAGRWLNYSQLHMPVASRPTPFNDDQSPFEPHSSARKGGTTVDGEFERKDQDQEH